MDAIVSQEQQPEAKTFAVEGEGRRRLDAFLSAHMPEASRARVQAAIREGQVPP
jgi:23S rRNA-/tRNA-specific pseudouridylate synthase